MEPAQITLVLDPNWDSIQEAILSNLLMLTIFTFKLASDTKGISVGLNKPNVPVKRTPWDGTQQAGRQED